MIISHYARLADVLQQHGFVVIEYTDTSLGYFCYILRVVKTTPKKFLWFSYLHKEEECLGEIKHGKIYLRGTEVVPEMAVAIKEYENMTKTTLRVVLCSEPTEFRDA